MAENRKIDRNDLEMDSGSDMPLANQLEGTIHGGPTTACTTLVQA